MGRTTALLIGLALVAATGACSASDDEDSAAERAGAPTAATATAAPAAAELAVATADAPVAVPVAAQSERLLVVDVTIGIAVDDVAAAVSAVISAGRGHSAQVYATDVDLHTPETSRARVVLKVPPGEVEAAIEAVAAVGRLVHREQRTDDVTEQVTDLETRIATSRESVARVQALLAGAEALKDVVLLEGELTKRQTELEQLLATQRNLTNQVAMATLTVDISAATDDLGLTAAERDDETIGGAFRAGARGFVNAVEGVLIFVGWTAPFLVLAGVAAAVALLVRRTRARSAPEGTP